MRAARYPAWCVAMGAALAAASCRRPPPEGGAAAPVVIVRDGGVIEAGNPAPAGALRASSFSYVFARYYLPKALTDPARAVAQRLRGAHMALGTSPARERKAARPTVWIEQPSIAELPPPSTEELAYSGRG